MKHLYPLLVITLAATAPIAGSCGGEGKTEQSAEQRLLKELNELTASLLEPLNSSKKCREIGKALEAWELKNAERYSKLWMKIKKLEGADAASFQTVKARFDNVAIYCIRPKQALPPLVQHDANVERVYKLLPKTSQKFVLK